MDENLIGSGYCSQWQMAAGEDHCAADGGKPQLRWGAMFHPVLGQVWVNPAVEGLPELDAMLLEESMHVQETLLRPAHLLPLRRYLHRKPHWPDAAVFRDIVECQYVALSPLLLRQPISVDSLPKAPPADREAAERLVSMADRLAEHDVADLTVEQRRRFALSALTTIAGAAIPPQPGSLSVVLDHLEQAVDAVAWRHRFDLEQILVEGLGLPLGSSDWGSEFQWRGELMLDQSVLFPHETMLINALHCARRVIQDPESVLPVLPGINAVLSRRNDVPIILVRSRRGDPEQVSFEILGHHERFERQQQPVDEQLPSAETDEPITALDEAWFGFDDYYLAELESRGPTLRVGDSTMAALIGLRAIAREGLGPALEQVGNSGDAEATWGCAEIAEELSALSDTRLEDVQEAIYLYGDWLRGDGTTFVREELY